MLRRMKLSYEIDGEAVSLDLQSEQAFGPRERLIDIYEDPLSSCDWYDAGYAVRPLFSAAEMDTVRAALARIICDALEESGIATKGFTLERYHDFATEAAHETVIARTRRLEPQDFGVRLKDILSRLSDMAGKELSFFNPILGSDQWVICRINRPRSNDFNPVHKDIYEALDRAGTVPAMVNIWIPICGVDGRTGLPVAAGSHLIPEDRILRTKAGSNVNGAHYSVNSVTSWGGKAELTTISPASGEALIFSSHLIHGFGRNLHADTTRISFEFRLFIA